MANRAVTVWPTFLLIVFCSTVGHADEAIAFKRGDTVVNLDVNQAPELKEWGTKAAHLAIEWHPRICNLLPTKGVTAPSTITLRIIRSDKGVAHTVGNVITISSHHIKKNPDDLGLVVHELVHVIQGYPKGHPWWITEGIADYIRRVIFEGQSLESFTIPKEERAFLRGYNTAAGFLFWLESDAAPGIVKRLNSAIRQGEYNDSLFESLAGRSLDQLWQDYANENIPKR